MSKYELSKLIDSGREIEFIYNNIWFSITYGLVNGKEVISFCEFNKTSTEVETVEELVKVVRYGVTVESMIRSISKNEIWIYWL